MKLHEMVTQYRLVAEMDDADPQAIRDTLDSITDVAEEKIQNIGFIIKEKQADLDAIKKEILRLQKMKTTKERSITNLKDYAYQSMEQMNLTKVKSPLISVWIQNNPVSVNVTDETLIPLGFFVEQAPKLDKKALKEELQYGDIPGAELMQTKGLRVR